jgi:MoxR-like ATPase
MILEKDKQYGGHKMNGQMRRIHAEIEKVVCGKDSVIDMVLCAMLAGGHVLLEDIPGVGKTTMAVALSRAINLSYKRMQFTPDVMPSDILGFTLYEQKTGEFSYRPGCVFTNLFLADEINRTSPKTQAALLEVMEEHKVSVDGVTRPLPDPFFVIATQNPVGASGTQKLPDSQLDRFLVRLSLGYPDHQSATDILKGRSMEQIEQVQAVCTAEQFLQMQKQAEDIFCRDEILDYIVHLIEATRKNELLTLGISPRGSLALLKMSRAHAFMEERDFVTPEDIHAVFYSVFNHRIQLSTRAKAAGETEFDVAEKILATVPIPRLQ